MHKKDKKEIILVLKPKVADTNQEPKSGKVIVSRHENISRTYFQIVCNE